VSEHFMVVEHIPVRPPEGRAKPGAGPPELTA
jgi:hypothetical protein